jgi:hypothetical protein
MEASLRNRLVKVLEEARGRGLRPASKLLIARLEEWLEYEAETDEPPPIADEELTARDEEDEASEK